MSNEEFFQTLDSLVDEVFNPPPGAPKESVPRTSKMSEVREHEIRTMIDALYDARKNPGGYYLATRDIGQWADIFRECIEFREYGMAGLLLSALTNVGISRLLQRYFDE